MGKGNIMYHDTKKQIAEFKEKQNKMFDQERLEEWKKASLENSKVIKNKFLGAKND